MAPASTTAYASSGVCFAISANDETAIFLRVNSGSCAAEIKNGTAPASTTA